jgi:hypothetical protein
MKSKSIQKDWSSQERWGHLCDSGCMQQKMAPGNRTMFFREDSKDEKVGINLKCAYYVLMKTSYQNLRNQNQSL